MTPPKDRARRTQTNGHGAGTVLADRYRLEERVAGGGMGEVWRATDLLLQRTVAVKLLRESLAEDPIVAERFKREALMAAQLSHPNMAGVFDYVQEDGRPGIVMEFVDGETLAERLAREGRLSVAECVRIGSGLLSALRSAHDAGIIHRDVKPGNVMLPTSGGVKVTDFGIARAASDHTLTETGMVIGTAHYLAPEQVSGEPATPSSDLYSAGAILFEMLAGQKPFEAETPIAVAMKRLTEVPPPVRSLRKDVPDPVARVVARSLEREPSARYASADEMRLALEGAFGASQPATVPQRLDPTPTQVLPVASAGPGATTAVVRSSVHEDTGKAPAAMVAARRKREYKRLVVFLALLGVVAGLVTFLVLALTGGTDIVTVPDFKGKTFSEAKAQAEGLGLKVTRVDRDSARTAGTIANQNIAAKTLVATGSDITLYVSNGKPPASAGVPVPDVRGMDREEAEGVLKDQGFSVKVSEVETSEYAPGTVIGQDPGPDEMAQPHQEVIISVAIEPKRRGKHKGSD